MEEAIAYLNGPAARLLLVVLLARARGKTRLRAGEMKRLAGIESWKYWEPAIKQLSEAGLAEITKVPHSHDYEFTTSLPSPASPVREVRQMDREISSEIDSLSIYRTPTAKAGKHKGSPLMEPDAPEYLVPLTPETEKGAKALDFGDDVENIVLSHLNPEKYGAIAPKNNSVLSPLISESGAKALNNGFSGAIEPDLKMECIQVDLMDDFGDLNHRSSPAQARRRAQVAIVQKTWTHFFPAGGELLADNAKRFLRDLGNSAEEVYDFFERIARFNPKNPLTYARTVLEREGAKPASSPAPVAAVYVPGPEPAFDQAEADRVDRAAHKARIALWRRTHPNEPIPEDL